MTTTSSRLTAAAGACAAAAGAIFIAVQVNHPPVDLAHLGSTDLLVRETAKAAMAVLAMVGFTFAGDLLRATGRQDDAMEELKHAVVLFAEIGEEGRLEPEIWKLTGW